MSGGKRCAWQSGAPCAREGLREMIRGLQVGDTAKEYTGPDSREGVQRWSCPRRPHQGMSVDLAVARFPIDVSDVMRSELERY